MTRKPIQEQELLYHVTALDNLESILRNGLLSRKDVEIKELGSNLVDIADPEIIKKRKELGIFQFVPFHFFEPTAFTGAIFKSHPEESFCCITIKRTKAKEKNFKICTAHPLSPLAKVLDYDEGMKTIDWNKMNLRDYSDEESKLICMAECLATSPVKPEDFFNIFVPNKEIEVKVKKLVDEIFPINSPFFININIYLTQAGS